MIFNNLITKEEYEIQVHQHSSEAQTSCTATIQSLPNILNHEVRNSEWTKNSYRMETENSVSQYSEFHNMDLEYHKTNHQFQL